MITKANSKNFHVDYLINPWLTYYSSHIPTDQSEEEEFAHVAEVSVAYTSIIIMNNYSYVSIGSRYSLS